MVGDAGKSFGVQGIVEPGDERVWAGVQAIGLEESVKMGEHLLDLEDIWLDERGIAARTAGFALVE